MVETSLRGRPSFSTFLQSDTSAGGDGLTYYDYQRFLRSQKVALLQERRALAHIPGCKKVTLPTSRKVFQLKNRSPAHNVSETAATSSKYSEIVPVNELPKPDLTASKEQQVVLAHSEYSTVGKSPVHVPSGRVGVTWNLDDSKRCQTERLPRIPAHQHRAIKSATARDHHPSWPSLELQHRPPRPNTVAGVRDTEVQSTLDEENDKKSMMLKKGWLA